MTEVNPRLLSQDHKPLWKDIWRLAPFCPTVSWSCTVKAICWEGVVKTQGEQKWGPGCGWRQALDSMRRLSKSATSRRWQVETWRDVQVENVLLETMEAGMTWGWSLERGMPGPEKRQPLWTDVFLADLAASCRLQQSLSSATKPPALSGQPVVFDLH